MGEPSPIRLILASGSAARRDLLTRAGYRFVVEPAGISEPTDEGFEDARVYVQHVAWLKAAAVARRFETQDAVILTADTVGWFHGRAIGKPDDEADARRILGQLAGSEHELWTGVCLWRCPNNLQLAWQEMSRVAMTPMSAAEIESYLVTRTWRDCSGAYAIQEEGDPHVRVLSGSVSNVIGLPLESLSNALAVLLGNHLALE